MIRKYAYKFFFFFLQWKIKSFNLIEIGNEFWWIWIRLFENLMKLEGDKTVENAFNLMRNEARIETAIRSEG